MDIFAGVILSEIIATIVYTFLGLGLFLICFWVIDTLTHVSIQKEIVEKQNIAISVLLGAGAIAMAIIIANVIRS